MIKRIKAFCMAIVLMLCLLPVAAFAAENACSVEFYDASDKSKIDAIGSQQQIYAKVKFTAPSDGDAVLVIAKYDASGALQTATIENAENLSAGTEVEHTTKSIDVSGTDHVKIFVWDGLKNLKPAASNYGMIKKEINLNASASATVNSDNGVTTGVTTITAEKVSASVPQGTKVASDTLTLTVTKLEQSGSGISVGESEVLLPIDIHVDGIAADNTVPVIVTVTDVLSAGLNKGNLALYHVEDGKPVKMTEVETPAGLTAHNCFHYDAATGTITLAMATFSEVAVVSDTEKTWEGNVAAAFGGGTGTEDNPYIIANADQLAYLGDRVSNDNEAYGSACYKLISDINFGGEEVLKDGKLQFYPIGYNSDGYQGAFSGTFDGSGHTVSNIYQNTWQLLGTYDGTYYNDAMGLFGYVYGGTVKNLTVDNFSSDGEFTPTGVIAAYAANSTFKNIAITDCNPRVYNTGNGGIVGVGGNSDDPETYKLTFENITIDNTNKITALWGSWDVACGGLVGMFRGDGHVYMTNCHVAAQIDVYNDVCGNYQYYWYRYSGMMVGTNKNMTTDENGYTVPETDKFHAENCTVHFGQWNDYYYCELVANSLASYTHDHQFSRLTQVDSVDAENMTVTVDGKSTAIPTSGRYNYVVVDGEAATENATCYHFVDGAVWNHENAGYETTDVDGDGVVDSNLLKEDRQHYYLPFNQLFTGYGWGVKHIPVYNGENYAFEGITILDREVADSVTKFETKFTGDFLYRVGNAANSPVSLGTLFKKSSAVDDDKVKINDSGVTVTIDKVDENTNVSGTFTANTSEWEKGTIQFSGTGVVKVTIQDYNYCTPTTLYLEVVDATNVTTASFGGNSVLLNDVSVSSTLSTSGVIYGNGFTINMENAPVSEKNGAVFHLYDGAILKNLKIVGKEFTTVAMTVNDTNYGVSAVRAWGNVIIENCYISGCRSAVSVTGSELTIKDSVIANGVYSNVDFRSGILNLHNVTTVNEPHTVDGTKILGLGIVGNMTASAGRQLNVTGTLTQYNWVSQADCANIKASGVDSIFDSVFTEDKYAPLRYTYEGTTYVNTGILSLCSDFGASAVTGEPSDYSGMDVTATISGVTIDGYVWAPGQAGTLSGDDMKYHDAIYEWTPSSQGTSFVAPDFDFSATDLTVEDGVIQVSYESGSSYTLYSDTIEKLLDTTKYGQTLSYTVSMNGEDYTGKDIVLDETASQTYTIVYKIIDNLIYNKSGELTDNSYEVTKELKVFATVVDKSADAPTFTFYYGTNGSASAGTPHTTQPTNSYTSSINKVGETYYIMPNVSTTSANAIGSQTVDGETVYYPIVDGINVRSGNSTDYDFTRYYPVFKAVKISDNGTEYSYSGTTEMPDTVAWVEATIDSGNGASALNDGFGLYNNQYLCKIQKKAGNAESGGTSVVKYSYTALDGNTYYYYVGYRFYDEDEGRACVTPDTLVTLADGSKKEIRNVSVGEDVIAWNFHTGEYEVVPVSLCDVHSSGYMNVLHLYFDDGTELKVLGEHGIFDSDLNNFIFIDKDDVTNYLGHSFVKQDGNDYKTVKLVDYKITEENTQAYTIMSSEYHNVILEDMFTLTPAHVGDNFFNPFEIGEDMKYDSELVKADIEKYGLYTYEDFAHVLTYEQFKVLNIAPFKVAVGKGLVTYEGLIYLIENFINR